MVKHTQTIRRNCLSVFDHFVGLALKGLIWQIQFYWFKLAAIHSICSENVYSVSLENNQGKG